MAEKKPTISIRPEDLTDAKIGATTEHLQKAKEITLVRAVGQDTGSKDGLVTIATLSGAGLLSGLFIWAVWKILPETSDTTMSNMQASFSISMVIAFLLVSADAALARSAAKFGRSLLFAIPSAIFLALILGWIANSLYSSLVSQTMDSLIESGLDPYTDSYWTEFASKNHLNRGIAWSLLGLAAGIAVGIPSLAIKRIAITGAGGFAGGFIGGFLFDFFQGEEIAQITGLVITGAAVGLSVSLLEQVTKSSWLEIVKGGMAGKQFILYQNSITIGSSPAANVTLIKDPAIPGVVATIRRSGSTVSIISADRTIPISVNGVASFEHRLTEGAVIVLGSTEIRFREKAKQVNDSAIIRG